MLTVMCPNCRHRFPAAGCCEPTTTTTTTTTAATNPATTSGALGQHSAEDNVACYYGGLLVPRNAAGCFINAPTIVNGPAIIQTGQQQTAQILGRTKYAVENDNRVRYRVPTECHITTTCDLTGGSVTITTPGIQSGGCLIQSTDSGILVQPHIEVRPKLSGGGVLVQKRFSMDEEEESLSSPLLIDANDSIESIGYCEERRCQHASIPSGCQELPGMRRNSRPRLESCRIHRASRCETQPMFPGIECHARARQQVVPQCNCCREQKSSSCYCCCCCTNNQNLRMSSGGGLLSGGCGDQDNQGTFCKAKNSFNDVFGKCTENRESSSLENPNGLQIQVNATVQLPASLGQCTLNITATTTTSSPAPGTQRVRNNFNGGGLVQTDGTTTTVSSGINPGNVNVSANVNANERRDGAPSTPVSWLMPCPWGFDSYLADRDDTRLTEVKRLLQMSGWYHDGLSWQQSESLLKNAPVGRWLVRDSSDSRYTFAVSVQTTRGPTSVRVHYFLGQFRLDAEPRLALAMPVFDCPIKMLEYYVNYSKRIDQREQVWVDYSGQVYSQIYLTKPLVKEVRSLSHLARLAVNRNKLPTDQLPPLMKNYLAEYPYTL